MIRQWAAQILAVMRLELRKTFFARRGLWVYLLALAPVLLFLAAGLVNRLQAERLQRLAKNYQAPSHALRYLDVGDSQEEILKELGEPYGKRTGRVSMEGVRGDTVFRYTDGKSDVGLLFAGGKLKHITRMNPQTVATGSLLFAASFQFYFLRLALFFGCVGIFLNLFRGEMVDKSLHFYLLTPMRREVLLAGKYLTGLLATMVIFTISVALQLTVMLWQLDHQAVAEYLAGPGWGHIFSYVGVTALACVGYGSIFLAIGLLFRNPIFPTAAVLLWESANVFLPAALKKVSLIFYLQSLSPVTAEPDQKVPAIWKLLTSSAEPAGPIAAVCGVLILASLVLILSGIQARKLEINYSAE